MDTRLERARLLANESVDDYALVDYSYIILEKAVKAYYEGQGKRILNYLPNDGVSEIVL